MFAYVSARLLLLRPERGDGVALGGFPGGDEAADDGQNHGDCDEDAALLRRKDRADVDIGHKVLQDQVDDHDEEERDAHADQT